ncbi:hypothetical protein NEOLI_005055 [Neolecta irregularis DAH-3]|uniref:Uncharacterized protein n=1 Tax=Neolecta irregularis (strain DAH-3) TaxID=1198029 RepID=A0A1U7LQ12_NEOID|nr:hypothetical protein NEOLI_005055 [Neolecta irregularis DAH-3]|eukprot:OLL24719.1 hypothetical protein NEOLI_005055 [Neolecta irregularis DAH-3]
MWEKMPVMSFSSDEYFQLVDLLIALLQGRDIKYFTLKDADDLFRTYVLITQQMDSKKVTRAHFERFIDEYMKTTQVESGLRN